MALRIGCHDMASTTRCSSGFVESGGVIIAPLSSGVSQIQFQVGYLCQDMSRTELEWSKANASQADYEHMYLFCLHGKSRHLAIWKYMDLVESNANLNKFAKRRLLDGESYILPSEGVRALKQKCLVSSL
ncbi:unnamed protein product [Anisakis simplex]|uniref:Actin maturation protease n=1 Tax=Anisakis simplex TaxID=6269 RepID=A0A0M3J9G8_ANISI|nr:unnamed protein product [Anisakis simplex]